MFVHHKRGVRQVDPLSSTLSLVLFNFVIHSLNINLGTLLSDTSCICLVVYADDGSPLCEGRRQLTSTFE